MNESLVPAYRRLADKIRDDIRSGRYAPGDEIPGEFELVEAAGLSRTTVRNALRILRGEGLIDVPGPGRRSTVRAPLPRISRDGSRYQYEKDMASLGGLPGDSHLAREAGLPPDGTHVHLIDDRLCAAGIDVGSALGIPPEAQVHRYTFVLSAAGVPSRIAHHYYEAQLDDRVNASLPGNAGNPGRAVWPGGTMHQLARLAIEPDAVHDRIRARMPLPEETETLRIPEGVPVLDIRKTTYDTDNMPREVVDIVMPGDRSECTYAIQLARWVGGAAGEESESD